MSTLTVDDRRLLESLPSGLAVLWDTEALDFTTGFPSLSLSGTLLHRLDRFLLAGLIEPAEVTRNPQLQRLDLTDAGRELLR